MGLEQFEWQVRWLRDAFDLVSLADLVARIETRSSVRGLACLTFDDGYLGFFRLALPVLRSFGIPSTVFLVAHAHETTEPYWWDHPDLVSRATPTRRRRWLSEGRGDAAAILAMEGLRPASGLPTDLLPASSDEIRRHLGPDLTVGAHTHSHRRLTTLSDSDLRSELDDGAAQLADRLGARPRYLAYPYGAWDSRVRDAALAAGYEACFTLDAGRLVPGRSSLGALPRINVPAGIPDAAFEAWVSGLLPPGR